ncbi:hypothetical protein [Candidatus Poriferisodalis sp.]|uniref:hypothetical protein n=1 Tax=Candidatus Poriferisodalis sp. TaxID=3101277 RepID=UPI003C6EE65F
MPLIDAIDAFETLACQRAELGPRNEAGFEGLIHPVHASGCVCSWEILTGS